MTCVKLESLVQALSTSCCFVSNFEICRPDHLGPVGSVQPATPAAAQHATASHGSGPTPAQAPLSQGGAATAAGIWMNIAGPKVCEANFGFSWQSQEKWRSRPISRVLSWTVIPLGASSPIRSSSLPGPDAGRVMRSLFGLAPGGVCRAGLLPGSRCALTAPFHPCHASEDRSAVSFCCTFRRLAPPRRYLAPCPVEPGLSSAFLRMTRLPGRLRRRHCRMAVGGRLMRLLPTPGKRSAMKGSRLFAFLDA